MGFKIFRIPDIPKKSMAPIFLDQTHIYELLFFDCLHPAQLADIATGELDSVSWLKCYVCLSRPLI